MLYEIRTYTFKPLRGADWLALYKSEGLPLQKEFLGQLIGFFTTEIGDISQIVHIWAYKGQPFQGLDQDVPPLARLSRRAVL